MARAIDGELLELEIANIANKLAKSDAQKALMGRVMYCVEHMPTLTPPNEWVSVEERLPEKKQDVLMLFKSGNMAVGWWHDVDEHVTFWCAYTDDGFYTDCDDMPVYWMPLPAPPDRRPPEGEEEP